MLEPLTGVITGKAGVAELSKVETLYKMDTVRDENYT